MVRGIAPISPPTAPMHILIYRADFEATLQEVARVCSEVHVLANKRGGEYWATLVDLGLTEALTNVIRHGYGAARSARVKLTCLEAAGQWQLTLNDCGNPIPQSLLVPTCGSVFDFDPDDLHNIPERGMGLALIRSCFDSIDYQVRADGNHLLLTKKIDLSAV
jgi:anti-sigma regulatory factor (Ser/Thr protein kinase)